jgi:hypothetical protein
MLYIYIYMYVCVYACLFVIYNVRKLEKIPRSSRKHFRDYLENLPIETFEGPILCAAHWSLC